ncbi:hypothetical protein Bca4012_083636 [Brassica carinata]
MLFHRSSPVAPLLGGLERMTQWRTHGSGHVSTGFSDYPGDDIPGAGAVTTKLSQGVTREAPETSIGMVERTTTATAVLPPEPVPSGFTAERSLLQEDTLLLFFFSFCFLAHYEILIQMFTN